MGGVVVDKSMEFFRFLGHVFDHPPLFAYRNVYFGIRKLYFDNKNWKNNDAHISVEIQVLKTILQKDDFEQYIPYRYNWYLID